MSWLRLRFKTRRLNLPITPPTVWAVWTLHHCLSIWNDWHVQYQRWKTLAEVWQHCNRNYVRGEVRNLGLEWGLESLPGPAKWVLGAFHFMDCSSDLQRYGFIPPERPGPTADSRFYLMWTTCIGFQHRAEHMISIMAMAGAHAGCWLVMLDRGADG